MTPAAGRLLATLLVPALALAGCAVARSPAMAAGHAATTARPAVATAQSPSQRAGADAAAVLAAFVVPPDARRLPGAPSGQASQLKDTAGYAPSPGRVAKTGFWQMKGDPQQVLAWTADHAGRRHTPEGIVTSLPVPGRPETTWSQAYVLPPVPAVEDTRQLTAEVEDAGNGQAVIRVDAEAYWLPPRAASEMVPAAATAVTLGVVPSGSLSKKPPRP
jgi:hypothetical protein